MDKLIMYFLLFIIYAFLGYICEVIYVFIITKKITNRGYLYGPLVPIYAFGALIFIIPFQELSLGNFVLDKWYLVLFLAFFVPTLLEYITSFIMEKIFHMRWWDYSDKILNINGRVCLRNSLMFTVLVILVVYLINPLLMISISYIMEIKILAYVLAILLFIAIIIDFIFSTIKHVNISKIIIKLNELKDKANELRIEKKEEITAYFNNIKDKISKINVKYPSLKLIKDKRKISLSDIINKFKK